VIKIKNLKRYALTFVFLTILFFIPSIPSISEIMVSMWSFSLFVYWILLTIIAIALGLKAIEGCES